MKLKAPLIHNRRDLKLAAERWEQNRSTEHMSTAIKLYSLHGERLGYLKSYDPDVGDDTITGDVVTTFDIRDALIFANTLEAVKFAMQPSKRVPLRQDGEPNRPLTAFTIEFERIDP